MLQTDSEIIVQPGQWHHLPSPYFYHATDGQPATHRTQVRLRLTPSTLQLAFDCLDAPFHGANTYHEHNTDLWRQEVFELFIAEGAATPTRYLELELNPNNALFVGWIDNPNGLRPDHLAFVPYAEAGIRHRVTRQAGSWSGELEVPLSLIGPQSTSIYRLNFYRITLLHQPETKRWECDPTNCAFLGWRSTLSGERPAFHRPAYFGTLRIA
ncbi:hypothetical protein GCM10027275_24460 [Rhabdobacter roseus]|uniref:Carbohydrate-binding domain-containing protein n=1 Tax=Rhabdobacter roseus TaxID=1655419 RepID=A0A840TJL1_9BACT|nr:carbohydrate-binding family 9-like protein [Rhabdobacter roseus]MBB5284386.1 hypothetical protein [Rhabdobacter roseus]